MSAKTANLLPAVGTEAFHTDIAHFQSEGRLLQELGERLVARPEVAIVELIKNAHDADSASCSVEVVSLLDIVKVQDFGIGMTEEAFLTKWMRIATDSKNKQRTSIKYKRKLTGEKGIGRFAVRFLGKSLKLTSIADDETRGFRTRLVADFDWDKVDSTSDLAKVEIEYGLWRVDDDTPTGTTLDIGRLRVDPAAIVKNEVRSAILRIVSPVSGLDRGRFERLGESGNDKVPGFSVSLPPLPPDEIAELSKKIRDAHEDDDDIPEIDPNAPIDLSQMVLRHGLGRITIDLNGKKLRITAEATDWPKGRQEIKVNNYKNDIESGFIADIRYFPKRSGMFQKTEVNGKDAWTWVRSNSGVSIIDHGLRIMPYGYGDNDWLWQDADSSSNRRKWRTPLMVEKFGNQDSDPQTNPMLALPQKRQVVGAVFVDSQGSGEDGLIPATDREGYFENDAFRQIQILVRTGLELLAWVDKRNQERLLAIEANKIAKEAQKSFAIAIERIKASRTLSRTDKNRIVKEYGRLSTNLQEAKDYTRKAAFNLDAMSLLGVVAGFMTHESSRIMLLLSRSVNALKRHKDIPQVAKDLPNLERTLKEFEGYVEYTSAFVGSMNGQLSETSFAVKAVLEDVIERFNRFAEDRHIEVEIEADEECMSPTMSVPIYTGIALNLYTNALKAVIAESSKSKNPKIQIKAWNDNTWHNVEVIDNGIGIADELRDRIWDPLFTTTSNSYNPLGSGMGLGLSLVKRLVETIGGKIELIDPPADYSTCFRVRYKLTNED